MNGRAGLQFAHLVLAITLAPAAAVAVTGDLDAAVRVRQLDESFRCVVCQNQSLADSNAELAADLRAQIREQVRNGATDDQIRAYMVRRYGDFVLYRPPVKPITWALWFGPFVVLVAGAIAMWRTIVRRSELHTSELDAADRARAAALCDHVEEGAVR